MGMAFANISVFHANPVVETLIAEGQLSDPVFAFKLASSESELSIGGVDSSLYTGSFSYTPVIQQVRPCYSTCLLSSVNVWGPGILANQYRLYQWQ